MQLHLVIWQNPLLNKTNLKEKKKKKKKKNNLPCRLPETGEAESACSLEQQRHPSGNIFPPVSGNQCTDNTNISVAFFAIKLLAHSWQKYVVKLPGLAWAGLGTAA